MNLWSHRFSQNTNKRFLPSLLRTEILTFLFLFWEKRWLHKFILKLTDLYKEVYLRVPWFFKDYHIILYNVQRINILLSWSFSVFCLSFVYANDKRWHQATWTLSLLPLKNVTKSLVQFLALLLQCTRLEMLWLSFSSLIWVLEDIFQSG